MELNGGGEDGAVSGAVEVRWSSSVMTISRAALLVRMDPITLSSASEDSRAGASLTRTSGIGQKATLVVLNLWSVDRSPDIFRLRTETGGPTDPSSPGCHPVPVPLAVSQAVILELGRLVAEVEIIEVVLHAQMVIDSVIQNCPSGKGRRFSLRR